MVNFLSIVQIVQITITQNPLKIKLLQLVPKTQARIKKKIREVDFFRVNYINGKFLGLNFKLKEQDGGLETYAYWLQIWPLL